MKSRSFWALLVAIVLLGAACGGGDVSGDPAASDAGQTSGADNNDGNAGEGPADPAAAGSDRPVGADENFPVPIPAGWEIDIYQELKDQGLNTFNGVSVLYSADDFDRVVAFYDDWTEAEATEYSRTVTGDQIGYIGMESPVYWVTVIGNDEQRGQTWTHLGVVLAEG